MYCNVCRWAVLESLTVALGYQSMPNAHEFHRHLYFFYRIYSLRTSLVEHFREKSALRRTPEKQLRNFCMNYGLIFFFLNLLLCSIFDHVSTEGRKINFLLVYLNVAC